MTSTNGTAHADVVLSTARGASARCLALAVVQAFDVCEASGIPLSQLQRVAIVEAVLVEFDGFGDHLSSLASISRLLHDLEAPDN